MPTSSRASLTAVSKSVRSSGDLWPPGKATCPDQGSPLRSVLLIRRIEPPWSVGSMTIATAAAGKFVFPDSKTNLSGSSRRFSESRLKAPHTCIHLGRLPGVWSQVNKYVSPRVSREKYEHGYYWYGQYGKRPGKGLGRQRPQGFLWFTRPTKGETLASYIGHNASGGTISEAAKFGEAVLLATHYPVAADAIKAAGSLQGKILIDGTNPLMQSSASTVVFRDANTIQHYPETEEPASQMRVPS